MQLRQYESVHAVAEDLRQQLTEQQKKVATLQTTNSDLEAQYELQCQDMKTLLMQTEALQKRKVTTSQASIHILSYYNNMQRLRTI